jgi:hypothetical protein
MAVRRIVGTIRNLVEFISQIFLKTEIFSNFSAIYSNSVSKILSFASAFSNISLVLGSSAFDFLTSFVSDF